MILQRISVLNDLDMIITARDTVLAAIAEWWRLLNQVVCMQHSHKEFEGVARLARQHEQVREDTARLVLEKPSPTNAELFTRSSSTIGMESNSSVPVSMASYKKKDAIWIQPACMT